MNISHQIKDQVSLSRAAAHFDIPFNNTESWQPCPFCGGGRSFKVNRDQHFKCLKCDASGSVFDFLIHHRKAADFKEALQLLKPLANITTEQYNARSPLAKLWNLLKNQDETPLIDWLTSRGLPSSIKDEAGVWTAAVSAAVASDPQLAAALNNEWQLTSTRFEQRVLFPVRNLSGNIVHFTARAVNPEAKVRWLHTSGSTPINNYLYQLNTVAKQQQDYVILCEGVSDCLSLRSLGEPALGTFGVNIPLVQHAWAMKDRLTHLVAMFDRDKYALGTNKAGQYKSWTGMTPALIDLALELKIPVFCCLVPNWSGVKDINDFLVEIEFDQVTFRQHLANHAVSLQQFAFNQYKNDIKEHHNIWRLLKSQPHPETNAKLKNLVAAEYNDWTDYVRALW